MHFNALLQWRTRARESRVDAKAVCHFEEFNLLQNKTLGRFAV
jgi:hypothetical protein